MVEHANEPLRIDHSLRQQFATFAHKNGLILRFVIAVRGNADPFVLNRLPRPVERAVGEKDRLRRDIRPRIALVNVVVVARAELLAKLLPWDHPNYGTDEGWIRSYPYEVAACSGGECAVEVRATNHAGGPSTHHAQGCAGARIPEEHALFARPG